MRVLFVLILGWGCGDDAPEHTGETGSSFDCLSESSDSCIQQACQACVDACGGSCSVDDIYPPQYSCPGADYFLVEDFCPDWTPEF